MKYIRSIPIFLLLIIFPVISYIYLNRGFKFRKEALTELEVKDSISDFDFPVINGKPISAGTLKNQVSLIYNANEANNKAFLEPIYEQFSPKKEFQMIGLSRDSAILKMNPIQKQWIFAYGDYPFERAISLVDTSMMIRNYYDFDSISFQKLNQHLSIVIPREKEKDVVMKPKK